MDHSRTQQATREYSELMFRSRYRIEIAQAISRSDPPIVYVKGLAEMTGLPDNRVHKEVHCLERLKLLVRLPRPRGQQLQEYQVVPSPFWEFVCELAAEIAKTATVEPPRGSEERRVSDG
jgi:hypothetical protein